MKYTLLHNPDNGYALYDDKAMLATWGAKETMPYVLSQCELRMGPDDELVESTHRGPLPESLPTARRPKAVTADAQA